MRARLPQPVLLGLLAVLLEAVFVALRRQHPLDENIAWVVALGFLAGVIYLCAAYLVVSRARSSPAALIVVLLAAVVFRATLFDLPPTLSSDLYRYQWEGAVQVAGHNPYQVTPGDPELQDLQPPVLARLPVKNVPTAYAPLTELFFGLTARLDGLPAFKLLSVGFDLGTLLLLLGLLRRRGLPAARALLYGWCPLVVLEFAGSGHNDSLALFFLLAASLLIIRRRSELVSNIALAAAVMCKWFPAVTLPVYFRRTRWRGGALFAASAALLLLPYSTAGGGLLKGLLTYAEHWRNNASLYALFAAATGEAVVATGLALGIVGGLALHLARMRSGPLRSGYLLLAAVLLVSPSVFPWYVTWLVPFLCFFPRPAFLLWTVTVLLSYHVLIDFTALGVWHYTPWLVWLEYLPVYGLLLWEWWRPRR
jgi:alpha-1,6-mannosyltransferase